MSGESYLLDLGESGGARAGTIGPLGQIEERVPLGREEASLRVGDVAWDFRLEQDAPAEETAGLQLHLAELGFDPGLADGVAGPKTEAALGAFQRASGLEDTGQADGPTQETLAAAYERPSLLEDLDRR
ncbi:MAG: peptidoglycan-binding protein, partial [Planctomycetes bacterium]|nr:peptidoglycan-binding protein [Planctomycetota bacterium]